MFFGFEFGRACPDEGVRLLIRPQFITAGFNPAFRSWKPFRNVKMKNQRFAAVIASLLSFLFLVAPIASARTVFKTPGSARRVIVQTQPNDSSEESATMDELFGSGTYSIYFEVRDYGYQVRSGAITEILEPLAPLM